MTDEVPQPKVRIFTSIVKIDERGQAQKQFFDVPLLKSPILGLTDWMFFMQGLLNQRGMLVENAWIPERMIELVLREPDTNTLLADADPTNIVRLR